MRQVITKTTSSVIPTDQLKGVNTNIKDDTDPALEAIFASLLTSNITTQTSPITVKDVSTSILPIVDTKLGRLNDSPAMITNGVVNSDNQAPIDEQQANNMMLTDNQVTLTDFQQPTTLNLGQDNLQQQIVPKITSLPSDRQPLAMTDATVKVMTETDLQTIASTPTSILTSKVNDNFGTTDNGITSTSILTSKVNDNLGTTDNGITSTATLTPKVNDNLGPTDNGITPTSIIQAEANPAAGAVTDPIIIPPKTNSVSTVLTSTLVVNAHDNLAGADRVTTPSIIQAEANSLIPDNDSSSKMQLAGEIQQGQQTNDLTTLTSPIMTPNITPPSNNNPVVNGPTLTITSFNGQQTLDQTEINKLVQSVTQQVSTMQSATSKTISFQVQPANLGPIRVNLQVDANHVKVEFKIEQSQTHEILASVLPKLQEVLKASTETNFQITRFETPTPTMQNSPSVTSTNNTDLNNLNQHFGQQQHNGQRFGMNKRKTYQVDTVDLVEKPKTQAKDTTGTINILA